MSKRFVIIVVMNNSESNREPSHIYLSISFTLLGMMQIISIGLSSILTLTISFHRHLRTVPNLLTANSSIAIFLFAWFMIAQMIIGFQPIHSRKGSLCILLSYLTCIATDAICYSYLVTAISQYFFNILYRRKYLLTFSIHEFIIFLSWSISCLLPLFLYLQGKCKVFLDEMMMLIGYSRYTSIFSRDAYVYVENVSSMGDIYLYDYGDWYSLLWYYYDLSLYCSYDTTW